VSSIISGKTILITGGTGTIGTALAEYCIENGAKKIKIFSNDENGLYEMEQLYTKSKLEFIIGDIRDESTTNTIVNNVDIVFHAAALKHVDRCEYHPIEAFSVNVIGTKNIVQSSMNKNVKKVILISSDKAVNPIGVMGATKLLAEKLFSSESSHKNSSTVFASVRFGNVIQSRGSILPKIENQISKGGPITLTDSRMQRFFMTKEDCIDLIIHATKLALGGEVFVLKMPLLKLNDLFAGMKEILAPKYGYKPSEIKTKIIGITPGEKIIEHLLTTFEMENALETKNFFIIPPLLQKTKRYKYSNSKKPTNIQSYFTNLKPISKKYIIKLLKQIY